MSNDDRFAETNRNSILTQKARDRIYAAFKKEGFEVYASKANTTNTHYISVVGSPREGTLKIRVSDHLPNQFRDGAFIHVYSDRSFNVRSLIAKIKAEFRKSRNG